MSEKPREFWIFPGVEAWQTDEVVMNPKCVKPYHIHVIEYSAYERANQETLNLMREKADFAHEKAELTKERDHWKANHDTQVSRKDNLHKLYEAERAKSQKLVEALRYIKDKREDRCWTDGKCLCVFDTAHFALAEYAKDTPEMLNRCPHGVESPEVCYQCTPDFPVESPKFDKEACLAASDQTSHWDRECFFQGARWQFNQIYPHTKSGGDE